MDANNPGIVFRFLPFLYFTESYIYQVLNKHSRIGSLAFLCHRWLKNLWIMSALQLDNINEIISNQSTGVSSKEVGSSILSAMTRDRAIFRFSFILFLLNRWDYVLNGKYGDSWSCLSQIHLGLFAVSWSNMAWWRRGTACLNLKLTVSWWRKLSKFILVFFIWSRIRKELGFGVEYWALERHLCNSMALKKNVRWKSLLAYVVS